MNTTIRNLLAMSAGVLCSLTATVALAGGLSGKTTIDQINVRSDQTITVKNASGKWKNPDACDGDTKVVLLPGVSGYKELYAALVGAHLTDRKVNVRLNGCTPLGNQTYPVVSQVTIL